MAENSIPQPWRDPKLPPVNTGSSRTPGTAGTPGTPGTTETAGTAGNKQYQGGGGGQGAQQSQQSQQSQQTQRSQQSQQSQRSQGTPPQPPQPQLFLRASGGYERLTSYKKATVIYDLTYYFAHRFLDPRKDRTVDQMVQAARSGKQNIAEGSTASATSTETELKLTNVARASMEELLTDYVDYLRVRQLPQWSIGDPRTKKTREFCKSHEDSADFMKDIDQRSDEAIANIAITLIHQFDRVISRQIESLEKDFVAKGGIREQMTAARLSYRNSQRDYIARLESENAQLRARIAELEGVIRRAETTETAETAGTAKTPGTPETPGNKQYQGGGGGQGSQGYQGSQGSQGSQASQGSQGSQGSHQSQREEEER